MARRRNPRHRGYQKKSGSVFGAIIGLLVMSVIMIGMTWAINFAYDRLTGNEYEIVLVEETETER